MNKPLTLTKPRDQELSDAVATRLCGWEKKDGKWIRDGMPWSFAPNFASSANSAIDLFEQCGVAAAIAFVDGSWSVSLGAEPKEIAFATDKSLPRAICIAILKADGVEVYG